MSYWTSEEDGQARLVHINEAGLAFALADSKTIRAMAAKLDEGQDPDSAVAPYVRKPWAQLGWVEWYGDEVSFEWDMGMLGKGATIEIDDAAAREQLTSSIERLSGMARQDRSMSLVESVKGPATGAGLALLLSGILYWMHGANVHGGGRSARRARFFSMIADLIGLPGIIAIAALGILIPGAIIAMRLKNPPTVARLER